jgi:hypothetical protein
LEVTSIGERAGIPDAQELLNFHLTGLLLMLNAIVQENEENEDTKLFYDKEILDICINSLGIAEETVNESFSSVKALYLDHKDELDDMHPDE